MFSSIVARLFKSKIQNDKTHPTKPQKQKQPINILEHSILDLNGTLQRDFTLFHHDNKLLIDLLIFLPHYGLYFGEKISWTAQELQEASIERFSKKNKKSATTRLEATEKILHQKLEDVLSFDSTPIQRFFWMEHLCESEFDALHSSFHTLLSKDRLIFSDDDIQHIQEKLFSLSVYQEAPYSKLKVLGSLQAHTLLLPALDEPFGTFLSTQQQAFLNAPLEATVTILNGNCASGKSTVLIRKVLQELLGNINAKAVIVTPTLLSGEILRKEFIALCDFSAVELDDTRLTFLSTPAPYDAVNVKSLPKDASIIVYDGFQPFNATFVDQMNVELKEKSIFITSPLDSDYKGFYPLTDTYRFPTLKTIQFAHTKGAIFSLLMGLRELFNADISTPILVILNHNDLLTEYKTIIDEYLNIECQLLTSSFSLQYKNLDSVTLTTAQYISGVSVPHCYVINLQPNTLEYSIALTRATHSVTVISEDIHYDDSISQ